MHIHIDFFVLRFVDIGVETFYVIECSVVYIQLLKGRRQKESIVSNIENTLTVFSEKRYELERGVLVRTPNNENTSE